MLRSSQESVELTVTCGQGVRTASAIMMKAGTVEAEAEAEGVFFCCYMVLLDIGGCERLED